LVAFLSFLISALSVDVDGTHDPAINPQLPYSNSECAWGMSGIGCDTPIALDPSTVNITDTPLRVLSLDGGGVRGISSLYILKELMAQIAREHKLQNPDAPNISPRPCEYFDLISGTSTGGLIALMLGRLRMVTMAPTFLILTCSPWMRQLLNTKRFQNKFSQVSQMTPRQFSIIRFSSEQSKMLSPVLESVARAPQYN
jgi:hypothetical protein